MPELFTDLADTTVAVGGYTAGSGVLNVASTGSPFPSTATFSVVVSDQNDDSIKALLKVTGVNSGTQWAVASEGTDNNAVASDVVTLVLTKRAIEGIIADANQMGVYASLPSTTGQRTGNRYKQTDGPYEWIFNGSIWVPFYKGDKVTLPLSSGWTIDNAGASTLSFTNGYAYFQGEHVASSVTIALAYRTAPSTPYTVTFLVKHDLSSAPPTTSPSSAVNSFGFGFRESATGKIKFFRIMSETGSSLSLLLQYWSVATNTSPTSLDSYNGYSAIDMLRQDSWWRITDNGTNLLFFWSIDGQRWRQIFSTSRTTNFTTAPDQYGFGSFKFGGITELMILDCEES